MIKEKCTTAYLIRHLYTSYLPGIRLHVLSYVRPPLSPQPVCSRHRRLVASQANSIASPKVLRNKRNLREESL